MQVKNPFEENDIVGITNYIDFGFELQTRYSECIEYIDPPPWSPPIR